jgi:hypothetical protein
MGISCHFDILYFLLSYKWWGCQLVMSWSCSLVCSELLGNHGEAEEYKEEHVVWEASHYIFVFVTPRSHQQNKTFCPGDTIEPFISRYCHNVFLQHHMHTYTQFNCSLGYATDFTWSTHSCLLCSFRNVYRLPSAFVFVRVCRGSLGITINHASIYVDYWLFRYSICADLLCVQN